MRKLLKKLKLSFNEEKSRIVIAKESLNFISFNFFRRYITGKSGKITIKRPLRKAVRNLREKAKPTRNEKNNLANNEEEAVRRINYFNYANASKIYNVLQKFIDCLFYKFIDYRHKKASSSSTMFINTYIARNLAP